MGWRFWRREQTEAERSLAALQEQGQAVATRAPAVAPVSPVQEPVVSVTPGQRHMERVSAELERLLADVPEAERGGFMVEVVDVRPGPDGTVVLAGGSHHGAVGPGAVVGLMVVGAGAASVGDDPGEQDRALLEVRAVRAVVVTWSPEPPTLVVSGVGVVDVTVGSMAFR